MLIDDKPLLSSQPLLKALLSLSELILILGFLWYKATNFQGMRGDCRSGTPTDFIMGISAGKLDSFGLNFVSISDKSGSIINDYL